MKFSAKEVEICKKKKVYKTKNRARYAAGKIAKELGDQLKAPLSVYHCPVCRKYHLTSLPVEQQKRWAKFKENGGFSL